MKTARAERDFAELVKEGRKIMPPWRTFLNETSSRLAMLAALPFFGEHEHRMMFDAAYKTKYLHSRRVDVPAEGSVDGDDFTVERIV